MELASRLGILVVFVFLGGQDEGCGQIAFQPHLHSHAGRIVTDRRDLA